MGWKLIRRVRRKRRSTLTPHYRAHKEQARTVVSDKLVQWNALYGFSYNRVAIRNTRRNWGSCTSLRNLNFNYKVLFLPEHLQDYIIVHELCHLCELNHGVSFWELVAQTIPDYKARIAELKKLEKSNTFTKPIRSEFTPELKTRV